MENTRNTLRSVVRIYENKRRSNLHSGFHKWGRQTLKSRSVISRVQNADVHLKPSEEEKDLEDHILYESKNNQNNSKIILHHPPQPKQVRRNLQNQRFHKYKAKRLQHKNRKEWYSYEIEALNNEEIVDNKYELYNIKYLPKEKYIKQRSLSESHIKYEERNVKGNRSIGVQVEIIKNKRTEQIDVMIQNVIEKCKHSVSTQISSMDNPISSSIISSPQLPTQRGNSKLTQYDIHDIYSVGPYTKLLQYNNKLLDHEKRSISTLSKTATKRKDRSMSGSKNNKSYYEGSGIKNKNMTKDKEEKLNKVSKGLINVSKLTTPTREDIKRTEKDKLRADLATFYRVQAAEREQKTPKSVIDHPAHHKSDLYSGKISPKLGKRKSEIGNEREILNISIPDENRGISGSDNESNLPSERLGNIKQNPNIFKINGLLGARGMDLESLSLQPSKSASPKDDKRSRSMYRTLPDQQNPQQSPKILKTKHELQIDTSTPLKLNWKTKNHKELTDIYINDYYTNTRRNEIIMGYSKGKMEPTNIFTRQSPTIKKQNKQFGNKKLQEFRKDSREKTDYLKVNQIPTSLTDRPKAKNVLRRKPPRSNQKKSKSYMPNYVYTNIYIYIYIYRPSSSTIHM